MKITIDEDVCIKHKMTYEEFLIAYAFRQVPECHEVIKNLIAREVLIVKDGFYYVTQHWSDVLDDILCDSAGVSERTEESLMALAEKIRDCFPKGKMKDRFGRDTPYYYRCNKSEVSKALNRFFTQFGNYPDSEIIDATKRYVASFNGNYTGMRLAKYFIMKNPIKQDENGRGYVEQVSDLLTFLENKESEKEVGVVINSDDWMMNVRN